MNASPYRRIRTQVTLAAVAFAALCGPIAAAQADPTDTPGDTGPVDQLAAGAELGPPAASLAAAPAGLAPLPTADVLPAAFGGAPALVAETLPTPSTPFTTAQPTSAAMVAIDFALAQLGLPYVWGGNGPANGDAGFDCSGLTTAAYAAAGVTLPRTAHTQYYAGPRLAPGTALQPGDLVFYGVPSRVHHVGMYLGEGVMIAAPTFGKPVRLSYYRWNGDDYLGASRPSAGPALDAISLAAYGPIPLRVGGSSASTEFVAPPIPAFSAPAIATDRNAPVGPDPFAALPPGGTPLAAGTSLPTLLGPPAVPTPTPVPVPTVIPPTPTVTPGPVTPGPTTPGPTTPGPTTPGPTATVTPGPATPAPVSPTPGTPAPATPAPASPAPASPAPTTPAPTATATPEPTVAVTPEPTRAPTPEPTVAPTPEPVAVASPTAASTPAAEATPEGTPAP